MLIEVIPGAGVPRTVAQKAIEYARSHRSKDSFEENDQVWAVFDRDEHPNFGDAVVRCKESGIGVARSDPCFELWLILHKRDYDRPCDRHEGAA